MMDPRRATGKRGEDEACGLLVSLGHSILERNWRHGHKEVDIISLAGNELHIVEVKSKGELDINLFEERMTLAFKLTEEEYNRAVTSLMRIDTDLSKALLKLTEYE